MDEHEDSGQEIDTSGLPLEAFAESDKEDNAEFTEIQRALAEDTGHQFVEGLADATATESEEGFEEEPSEDTLDSKLLEDADAGDSEPNDGQPKRGSRANKRIQSLVEKNKELETQMAKMSEAQQNQMAYLQQQAQAKQATELQAQRENLALQRQQLDYLRTSQETRRLEEMDPDARDQLVMERKFLSQARAAVAPELKQLRDQLNAEKSERQQLQEDAMRRQRYVYYTQATEKARNDTLLNDFSRDTASPMVEEADEMILTYAAAFNLEPNDAAVRLKGFMDRYVKAQLDNRSNSGGKRIKRGRSVPKSAAKGSVQGKGEAWPSMESLKKAGFDSPFDWVVAGSPSVG